MLTAPTPPQLAVMEGSPFPLGAHVMEDGSVNFAVVSQFAQAINLCLFTDTHAPSRETHRVRLTNRTGDVWHVCISGIPEGSTYGYRADGTWDPNAGLFFNPLKLLLDPYATRIDGPSAFHITMGATRKGDKMEKTDSAPHAPRAFVPEPEYYDWEGDAPLKIPMENTVISEFHVKGFSKLNTALPEEIRGTYAGLAHPASIEYLKGIGITTVQLLPVHQHLDDGFLLDRDLVNYWGYNTLGFFAPEARYAATSHAVNEFRDMVKALHRAGIEVILDVVYNHTCEAGTHGPTCMFRGLDNIAYYHTDPDKPGHYRDYTGCGNSVDVSHPRALRLVMDSLRYWVEEMHVDGFRFDLAVELGRSAEGYDRRAAFFQAVHQDPVLSQTKLIAEPWDLGPGGYQIGNFPTDWAELNGKFRDITRRFWRGDPGVSGEFAKRITGSEDMFAHNRRRPTASINFITSHDGFTLRDLVSYNQKHNLDNGEKNNDGDSHNISYNHGAEGETSDKKILALRQRQIRNFLATTICAQGVPFILGGDERYRTQRGNNNAYCQDSDIAWISWEDSKEARTVQEFTKRLLKFRADNPALRRTSFFTGQKVNGTELPDVCWFRPDGEKKRANDWEVEKPGTFTMMIYGASTEKTIVFFFNARHKPEVFRFPANLTCSWELVADTDDPSLEGTGAECGTEITLVDRSMQIWLEA
ncbi:MAG: glycogen debranching enzyme GlgX [Verrucomicrobiales bacterium]|nr:glycogen debranching enzyme GlgX [Verrucomicrobiales bacterium]